MTSLYRLSDTAGRLLYIGVADQWTRRVQDHAQSKPWWKEVATTTVEHFPTREAALAAEKVAIQTERPIHNIIHNGKRDTIVTSPEHEPERGIVGRFVHVLSEEDGLPHMQGQIVSEPQPGIYEVLWFSFMFGEPSDRTLHRIEEIIGWQLYTDADQWRETMDQAISIRDCNFRRRQMDIL